jgi:hypothetical protein
MWGKIKVFIADRVKGFFTWLWDIIGWRGFAIILCVMGIAIVIAWLF